MNVSRVNWPPALLGRIEPRSLLAFGAIYLLWGGTFLAIRLAVLDLPPFLTAGVRFLLAGALLYCWARARGQAAPTVRQWGSIALLAACMFVATYGALFWAEQYLPSGITSVLEATQPIMIIALEVLVLRRQPLRWGMLCAVLLGFCGVALLLMKSGSQPLELLPCVAVLGGAGAWSLGAVLTRSLPLPRSLGLAAGAEMMLGGLGLLALAQGTGELASTLHLTLRALVSLTYLIVAGSLLAFTAYVWLLARMPATRVASHAYVNPLVAVALGYLVADETLTVRTLVASALIIASVFLILRQPAGVAQPRPENDHPVRRRQRVAVPAANGAGPRE
jgi:drug/metabolite transporter (DMT)-like permease